MDNPLIVSLNDLINRFDKRATYTITKRVVKVEQFGDDYNDFDMNALLNDKRLMQQMLLMEQEEEQKHNNTNDLRPVQKSYLPSKSELQSMTQAVRDCPDIVINSNQAFIQHYESMFTIDPFQFAIQFMILPKHYVHCWLGFVDTTSCPAITVSKEHALKNLTLSLPHRKPLNDEFGVVTMSSTALISGDDGMENTNDTNFMFSSNDLSMKLSKMLCKMSKNTVQIACDIPMQILNASCSRQQNNCDMEPHHNVLFHIENNVMQTFKNILNQSAK